VRVRTRFCKVAPFLRFHSQPTPSCDRMFRFDHREADHFDDSTSDEFSGLTLFDSRKVLDVSSQKLSRTNSLCAKLIKPLISLGCIGTLAGSVNDNPSPKIRYGCSRVVFRYVTAVDLRRSRAWPSQNRQADSRATTCILRRLRRRRCFLAH
jgi:hypothetical protein